MAAESPSRLGPAVTVEGVATAASRLESPGQPACAPSVIRKFSLNAMSFQQKKLKEYAFMTVVKQRTNEHSRMGRNILNYVHILDQKTAPFIILYIARPESVCHSKGRVFTIMSENLARVLGDGFLEDLHEKVMDFVHEQSSRSAGVATDINFEVERKRRLELEKENAELRRELKRARTTASEPS
ncbi:hypothetical protein BD414DRAFT_498026 [Trametes punicea]|nr:hypothetical protein BD414DRAFT_498026 [Trametes punicea]